jgi:TIR domain
MSERQALFISHASPEDNAFTIWLGAKLAAAGYEVWADVLRLTGGDDWQRKLEDALRSLFVREVDGDAVGRWYENLTTVRDLSPGTAVRHFNVMHHMMGKASTIWSKETGIDRNPADLVEVRRPDDQRDRYLSANELRTLKQALDDKTYRKARRP